MGSRDGGKPDLFQNPGSGSNPGFGLKNPGFPVPPIFYKNVHFFSIFSNLALFKQDVIYSLFLNTQINFS